jgi:hypothetical protein
MRTTIETSFPWWINTGDPTKGIMLDGPYEDAHANWNKTPNNHIII